MEILLHDGRREVMIRGNEGNFDLCYLQKSKEGKADERVFVASRYYSSLVAAFDALLKLKISNCEATSLKELRTCIESIREELRDVLELTIKQGRGK